MAATDIAKGANLTNLNENGFISVVAERHTCFEQYVTTRLTRGLSFVRSIGPRDELLPEPTFVVRCQ